MPQESIRTAIESIPEVVGDSDRITSAISIQKLLKPWLIITGLELKDALHQTPDRLRDDLQTVYSGLRAVLGLLPEDQLQEAACRLLGTFEIYGEAISDGTFSIEQSCSISWDGNGWLFISDPKLRLRETAQTYQKAVAEVRKILGFSK